MGRLANLDLTPRLARKDYETQLRSAQQRWLQLRLHIGGQMGSGQLGPGILVLFEGSDAAGKGGAIKRLVETLDPRHYRVSTFAAPSFDEKRHAFLWRFLPYVPGHGGMSVFDRSWYGRVLVERVEGFASTEEWSRAFEEIVGFERTIVTEGTVLVKFWLHISSDEQLRRFESRRDDPLRRWKITDEDWRNREKADSYAVAAEEMFERTDHHLAPWDIVSGEQKRYARVRVLETVISRVEQGMHRFGMPVPPAVELAPDGAE
jgi:polyphosphate kinase 2 (PPK2 family)